MQTDKVPCSLAGVENLDGVQNRVKIRLMEADEFIEKHASGTLRKSKRLGFAWKSQYLDERVAYEFGWGFEIVERTRVLFADAIVSENCQPLTEAGWHIERYMNLSIFKEDYFEAKYILVEYKDGQKKEGVGIVVRQTSAPFIPNGYIVFSIIAEFDPVSQDYKEAVNPF